MLEVFILVNVVLFSYISTPTPRYNLTYCYPRTGSMIPGSKRFTVFCFSPSSQFQKLSFSISFIIMESILDNSIQFAKSAIKVLCNCHLARSDVNVHLKAGMIWKKWETVQRFATTTQALSVKRTGFSRQPSHIKVTSGCQGDRLFEENFVFHFLGSSQERRMSSPDSRMANKVKFVCHWILESWRLLPWAHFALFYFLGCRIWKENWSRLSELDPFIFLSLHVVWPFWLLTVCR